MYGDFYNHSKLTVELPNSLTIVGPAIVGLEDDDSPSNDEYEVSHPWEFSPEGLQELCRLDQLLDITELCKLDWLPDELYA